MNIEEQASGRTICLNGTFSMDTKAMNKRLKALGFDKIDRITSTREYKADATIPPAKESTCLYVVGQEPNEDSLRRYELNKHDGYEALLINEDQLMNWLTGYLPLDIPSTVVKKLNINKSYYTWQPPIINDKTFFSRSSSPLLYNMETLANPLYLKEVYVPEYEGMRMDSFRQLIGNLGGYASRDYYDDTNIVLLSDETLRKLDQGEKDKVILDLERRYNESSSKQFDVQFTCESDFIAYVRARMAKNPDESTLALLSACGY